MIPVTAPAWTLLDLAAGGTDRMRLGGALDDVLVPEARLLGGCRACGKPIRSAFTLPGAGRARRAGRGAAAGEAAVRDRVWRMSCSEVFRTVWRCRSRYGSSMLPLPRRRDGPVRCCLSGPAARIRGRRGQAGTKGGWIGCETRPGTSSAGCWGGRSGATTTRTSGTGRRGSRTKIRQAPEDRRGGLIGTGATGSGVGCPLTSAGSAFWRLVEMQEVTLVADDDRPDGEVGGPEDPARGQGPGHRLRARESIPSRWRCRAASSSTSCTGPAG